MAKCKTGFLVPPTIAKEQSCQASSKYSKSKGNFFQKNLFFGLRLLNKLCSAGGQIENQSGGPSGYAQGPILPSFIQIVPKQRQLHSEKPQFRALVTKQTWPPGGQKSKRAIRYLWLWPRTNPAKFHPKTPKTKATSFRKTSISGSGY